MVRSSCVSSPGIPWLTRLCHLDHDGGIGRQVSEALYPAGGAELVTYLDHFLWVRGKGLAKQPANSRHLSWFYLVPF